MIRIFVVHHTVLIASIISSFLSEEPDIRVVGHAATVNETIEQLERTKCNIILVAARLPNEGALKLTEAVADTHPEIKVLVMGLPESKHAILQYVMAGASGYVLQDVPVEQLLESVRAAHENKALISPAMAAALMDHVAELAQISAQDSIDLALVDNLTPREKEVLDLIGKGFTNQEIADDLYIEVGTVKNHVHNLLKKLEVSSREDAASYLPFIQDKETE